MNETHKKSLFEATPEEIIDSCPLDDIFPPGFKMLTREELDTKGVHVKVTHETHKTSLFKATSEEILASRSRDEFFSPDCKILSDEELAARGIHIEVIDDTRSDKQYIKSELRARGYSGYYREIHDDVITRIIPVNIFGLREDLGPLPWRAKLCLSIQVIVDKIVSIKYKLGV